MASNEEVEEELLAIDAILEGGFTTERDASGRPSKIIIRCSPLVASMEERSYVGLTLEVIITPEYPNEEPSARVRLLPKEIFEWFQFTVTYPFRFVILEG